MARSSWRSSATHQSSNTRLRAGQSYRPFGIDFANHMIAVDWVSQSIANLETSHGYSLKANIPRLGQCGDEDLASYSSEQPQIVLHPMMDEWSTSSEYTIEESCLRIQGWCFYLSDICRFIRHSLCSLSNDSITQSAEYQTMIATSH